MPKAMFMEATGGQVSRSEGWVIYLTTQSDEPPAGVFKEKLNYFRDVRDAKIHDPKSLGVLFEFPAAMVKSQAYLDPSNFGITNPNLGRSVSVDWIADQLRKVEHKKDGAFQQFLAKHLNVEIGLSLRSDNWAGALFWEAQSRPGMSLPELLNRCEVIDVGIDGGGVDDLLGAAAAGRDRETGEWLTWCRAWAHPTVRERRKSEASRLRDLELDGDLVIVDRIGEDVEQLAQIVVEIHEAGLLDKIGVDPSGIGAVLDALREAGIPEKNANGEDMIVGISQGWKLGGTIKTNERKLAEGMLWHGGTAWRLYDVQPS